MAPKIKEMLVCEACGYIADREDVLTETRKGVHLKLRSYKCEKCDNLSEQPISNQKKDTDGINGKDNDRPNSEEIPPKPEFNQNKNRRKQKLMVMCPQCSFTASSTTLLLEHERCEHPENDVRIKISNSRVEFDEDELKHQDVNKELNVKEIAKSIQSPESEEGSSENDLIKNQDHLNATKEVLKTVQCTNCDFTTTKTAYLYRHFRLIHDKKLIFSCGDCEFKSARSDKFKDHVKAVHEKIRNRKCPHCDHASYDSCSLKNHIRSKHLKIKSNQCHKCDKSFTRPSYLKYHIKLAHSMVKDFQCPSCTYSTGWKPNLTMHIKVKHDKVKDLKCKHCSFSTGRPSALRGHKKNIHNIGKTLQCPYCIYKTKYHSS